MNEVFLDPFIAASAISSLQEHFVATLLAGIFCHRYNICQKPWLWKFPLCSIFKNFQHFTHYVILDFSVFIFMTYCYHLFHEYLRHDSQEHRLLIRVFVYK